MDSRTTQLQAILDLSKKLCPAMAQPPAPGPRREVAAVQIVRIRP